MTALPKINVFTKMSAARSEARVSAVVANSSDINITVYGRNHDDWPLRVSAQKYRTGSIKRQVKVSDFPRSLHSSQRPRKRYRGRSGPLERVNAQSSVPKVISGRHTEAKSDQLLVHLVRHFVF